MLSNETCSRGAGLVHRADGRTANGQGDGQRVRHGILGGGDNQRAFAWARVPGSGVDRVRLYVCAGDVAWGEVEYMCRKGRPLIDVNKHTAGGSHQVCVGVSDEHAWI